MNRPLGRIKSLNRLPDEELASSIHRAIENHFDRMFFHFRVSRNSDGISRTRIHSIQKKIKNNKNESQEVQCAGVTMNRTVVACGPSVTRCYSTKEAQMFVKVAEISHTS